MKRKSGTVEIRAPREYGDNQAAESRAPRSYQPQSDAIKQLIPELYWIYTLIAQPRKSRRKISAPDMIAKIVHGVNFENGVEVKLKTKKQRKAAA